MASIKAKANPDVLRWARKTAGYSIDDAARKISKTFKPERLAAWEKNQAQPTVVQLRKLARIYKRPLAVFFLSEVPKDIPVPRDFRRLPGEIAGIYSPKLRSEIRQAEARRQIALELYDELEETPLGFTLAGTMDQDPTELAAAARQALGIGLTQQMSWPNPYTALREWRESFERLGILVFQIPEISSDEMRGFSIYEAVLPVVAVNRSETPRARIFSLMHELTHLMLRERGVCDFDEFVFRPPEEQRIEVFCNSVAANILMPAESFLIQPEIDIHPARPREWDDQIIDTLSRRYSVSREAIVRRLLTFNRASEDFYLEKRAQYRQEFATYRATREPPREKYGAKRVRILGPAFSRLVLDTYHEGHITLTDVANYLGIKLQHLSAAEHELGIT
jgi:Zn-dependent peptidase ImmA (M78 family)